MIGGMLPLFGGRGGGGGGGPYQRLWATGL